MKKNELFSMAVISSLLILIEGWLVLKLIVSNDIKYQEYSIYGFIAVISFIIFIFIKLSVKSLK